uniref:E3 ubiquitin-protein ligase n=1 Tax=Syphacia muris TaxID=451379 RepID=A0A0N5ACJ6_9BILA
MPPGDSLDEGNSSYKSFSEGIDEKIGELYWEDKVMEEAKYFKRISDDLKDAGCPLFGGEFREDLPETIREKAAALNKKIDSMLDFGKQLNSSVARDQLRLFLAQGEPLSAFREKIKGFDFCLKCNAIWSSDAIAYRCSTCAYNPCMSLCLECFRNANHEGHDFNRFFSQAGGACDCGNSEVLRESGFCSRHGCNAKRPPIPSPNIISLVEYVIPKLFVQMFLHFRGWKQL